MPKQTDFFVEYDPHEHHRRADMDTSEAAAHSIDGRAMMAKIFRHLARFGPATYSELALGMQLRPDQVWRRLSDLKNQGLIEDTGLRRLGPTKRFQAVWQVVPRPS